MIAEENGRETQCQAGGLTGDEYIGGFNVDSRGGIPVQFA
jgi:hypothetical protein